MKTSLFTVGVTACLALWGQASFAADCIVPGTSSSALENTCLEVGNILSENARIEAPFDLLFKGEMTGLRAMEYVIGERAADPEVIAAASSDLLLPLARNSSAASLTEKIRFIGAIGIDPGVIVVAAESPYRDLKDLVNAAVADPGFVSFGGGSAVGELDHINVLKLMRASGFADFLEIKYISFESPSDAVTQTLGGVTEATIARLWDAAGSVATGDVRALAVLSEERVPGFLGIPTALEQGYGVVAGHWHGFYVSGDVGEDVYQEWADRLALVAAADAWLEVMAANALAPYSLIGVDFEEFVAAEIEDVREISRALGLFSSPPPEASSIEPELERE